MTTKYEAHKAAWQSCKRCPLWKTRKRTVLARGSLPCDVLFIGEAPGPGENTLGQPFVGPAGKLLDEIIREANSVVAVNEDGDDILTTYTDRIAFTNLVACIPLDPEDGNKFAQPPVDSILACAPRLIDLANIGQPKIIVSVGALSEDWADRILENRLPEPKRAKAGAKPGGAWERKFEPYEAGGYQYASIVHPAAILRMNVAQQGLAYQRAVVKLTDVFESLKHT